MWCSTRAKRAINGRLNLVSQERMSTTYVARLFKYAKRGFGIAVPGMHEGAVDRKHIAKANMKGLRGLAKLLRLEGLIKANFEADDRLPHCFVGPKLRYADRAAVEDVEASGDPDAPVAAALSRHASDYKGFRYLSQKVSAPLQFADDIVLLARKCVCVCTQCTVQKADFVVLFVRFVTAGYPAVLCSFRLRAGRPGEPEDAAHRVCAQRHRARAQHGHRGGLRRDLRGL